MEGEKWVKIENINQINISEVSMNERLFKKNTNTLLDRGVYRISVSDESNNLYVMASGKTKEINVCPLDKNNEGQLWRVKTDLIKKPNLYGIYFESVLYSNYYLHMEDEMILKQRNNLQKDYSLFYIVKWKENKQVYPMNIDGLYIKINKKENSYKIEGSNIPINSMEFKVKR